MNIYFLNSNFLRTILTAAHCICDPPERRRNQRKNGDDLESFSTCVTPSNLNPLAPINYLRDKPTYRLNQHTPLTDSNEKPLQSMEIWHMWDKKQTTKISSFNHVDVKIGSNDFTEAKLQGVNSAYVMYADNMWSFGDKPDIGLIVVERKINWDGSYPNTPVAPICLPSR